MGVLPHMLGLFSSTGVHMPSRDDNIRAQLGAPPPARPVTGQVGNLPTRPLPSQDPLAANRKEINDATAKADSLLRKLEEYVVSAKDPRFKKELAAREQREKNALQDEIDAFLAQQSYGDIAKNTGYGLANVAKNAITRSPLTIGATPLGVGMAAGLALGDLSTIGLDTYEQVQMKRKGTPRQRAERAYNASKVEWIEKKAREQHAKRQAQKIATLPKTSPRAQAAERRYR